ncbi:MAG TPA: DoxX family membrane protein [Actinotalea sp.]|nr:DoxX family membrane protein [Actinotalea sp.]
MNGRLARLARIDRRLTRWMAEHAVTFLRVSIGVVFIWFGVLKFFPGVSAADELATGTISVLTFGLLQPDVSRILLALLETAIGVGLLTGRFLRLTLLLLFGQMVGTVTPLFLFPEETWELAPVVPTLEGQYILKNMVLIAAGLTIGATVRGGGVLDDPESYAAARAAGLPPRDR